MTHWHINVLVIFLNLVFCAINITTIKPMPKINTVVTKFICIKSLLKWNRIACGETLVLGMRLASLVALDWPLPLALHKWKTCPWPFFVKRIIVSWFSSCSITGDPKFNASCVTYTVVWKSVTDTFKLYQKQLEGTEVPSSDKRFFFVVYKNAVHCVRHTTKYLDRHGCTEKVSL